MDMHSDNNVGDAGATALAEGLKHCTSLRVVYFNSKDQELCLSSHEADTLTQATPLETVES